MGFESGSISYRMLYLPRHLPEDAIERFNRHAAPPPDAIGEGETRGWVTGRHLLDRHITEDTARRGQYIFLAMQQAERKIPLSLLKAECKMEELARQLAEGKAFLNRQEKSEIKKEIAARLLPAMPPQIKGTHFIHDPTTPFLYAAALPAKQCDMFNALFQQTMGFSPLPYTPALAAFHRCKTDTNEWNPVSFSPDIPANMAEVTPGRDYLTWLWFHAEAEGGSFDLPEGTTLNIMIEGPLLFVNEGEGAHETLLRKGEPVNSAEAKTCLMGGKKLRRAKITFAIGEDIWTFNLEADEFLFTGLALPRIKEFLDSISFFEERMHRLEMFSNAFLHTYDIFCALRKSSAEWAAINKEIHRWAADRVGRI